MKNVTDKTKVSKEVENLIKTKRRFNLFPVANDSVKIDMIYSDNDGEKSNYTLDYSNRDKFTRDNDLTIHDGIIYFSLSYLHLETLDDRYNNEKNYGKKLNVIHGKIIYSRVPTNKYEELLKSKNLLK